MMIYACSVILGQKSKSKAYRDYFLNLAFGHQTHNEHHPSKPPQKGSRGLEGTSKTI